MYLGLNSQAASASNGVTDETLPINLQTNEVGDVAQTRQTNPSNKVNQRNLRMGTKDVTNFAWRERLKSHLYYNTTGYSSNICCTVFLLQVTAASQHFKLNEFNSQVTLQCSNIEISTGAGGCSGAITV